MYNDLLDGDQYHNDDVIQGDKVFEGSNSPHFITIDYESAATRNIRDIQRNIAREAEYQRQLQEEEYNAEIDARIAELDEEAA